MAGVTRPTRSAQAPSMNWLEAYWYRITPLHILLLPLSLLFWLLAALRRGCYRLGLLPSVALPVPVIVVGNITVGGSGKTPLVLWLADFLRAQGMHPGIVSRGYGGEGDNSGAPMAVTASSDPAVVGDEPVLLARRSGDACPVWVGHDRAASAHALLAAHPACNVLICDDGLQHYRLRRDLEIAVVDGQRRFGNGLLLPAGPLRENLGRLGSVDAIVVNGGSEQQTGIRGQGKTFRMELAGESFYNLLNPASRCAPSAFMGKRLHAIAGIGNPQRFFDHLQDLGLTANFHAFPDHHRFEQQELAQLAELADADAILMTEKDAVKCSAFANGKFWVLPVAAQVDAELGKVILQKLGK